jgi:hypothetical protein
MRDGFKCAYCGKNSNQEELEVDHIHPRSQGGSDSPSNLTTSCKKCNRGKRAVVIEDNSFLQERMGEDFPIKSQAEKKRPKPQKTLFYEEDDPISILDKPFMILHRVNIIKHRDLLIDSNWKFIASEYLRCENRPWLEKAAVSLYNSLYHQNTSTFITKREYFDEMIMFDKNWKPALKPTTKRFARFIDHIQKIGLVVMRKESSMQDGVYVFDITDPKLYDMVRSNGLIKEQYEECRGYVGLKVNQCKTNEPVIPFLHNKK